MRTVSNIKLTFSTTSALQVREAMREVARLGKNEYHVDNITIEDDGQTAITVDMSKTLEREE